MQLQPDSLTSKTTGIFISKKDAEKSGLQDALYRADLSKEDKRMIEEFKKGKND